jgi:hypothetical protein
LEVSRGKPHVEHDSNPQRKLKHELRDDDTRGGKALTGAG